METKRANTTTPVKRYVWYDIHCYLYNVLSGWLYKLEPQRNAYLKVCSLQLKLDSPLERIWTPKSPRSFPLMSSHIREFGDRRNEDTNSEDLSVSLHSANLQQCVTEISHMSTHYTRSHMTMSLPYFLIHAHLNVCSLQLEPVSPLERSWTPKSPRSFLLMVSSSKEFGERRTDDTISQHLSVSLQSANLFLTKNMISQY